jgi:D-glycero-D-manno-heptose 1,7-bisphosphate phosphatase
MPPQVVILDRDGTIIVERHYLSDPNLVELVPGAAGGLRHMLGQGLRLIVLTNQSAIGQGTLDHGRLAEIHQRMCALLLAEDVHLDGIYYCPHTPEDNCACRKPRTGLVDRAAAELHFDPRESVVIGDKPCDIDLGRGIGAFTMLVRTGYGAEVERQGMCKPDAVVDGLEEAAEVLGQRLGQAGPRMNPAAAQMFAPRTAMADTPVRAGVGVIVLDDDGRILLERRSDCGMWGFPGGKIEPGESILDAAIREVKEESGLSIEVTRLLGVYSEPAGRIVRYPSNGDIVHLVDVVLVARRLSGTIQVSPESLELRFFGRHELPEVIPPAAGPLRDFLAAQTGVMA